VARFAHVPLDPSPFDEIRDSVPWPTQNATARSASHKSIKSDVMRTNRTEARGSVYGRPARSPQTGRRGRCLLARSVAIARVAVTPTSGASVRDTGGFRASWRAGGPRMHLLEAARERRVATRVRCAFGSSPSLSVNNIEILGATVSGHKLNEYPRMRRTEGLLKRTVCFCHFCRVDELSGVL